MGTKITNFKEGKVDAGLLFVTGLFFLTLALVVVYVSRFGMEPLLKQNNVAEMGASASLALSESTPSPADSPNLYEIENGDFFASLPETPVREIFIGSYGAVDKTILENLRDRIELAFGVKTTLLNPGAAIPKEEPFYSQNRNEYNSDVLIKSVEHSSMPYGKSVRFLYVVDLNMTSFSEESQGGEWLRARREESAALISLGAFRLSDSGISSQALLLERTEKAAIRAIGTTVGFDASPSATDASCVMYPAATIRELDAQGDAWCGPEQEALAQVFQK